MGTFIAWLLFSIVAGLIATSKGRSGAGFFVLSLLLSPLVGLPAALFVSRRKASGTSNPRTSASKGAPSPQTEVLISSSYSTGKLRGPLSKSSDCWVRPGVACVVRGVAIPGGMVYVGRGLPAINEWHGVEPALIDPSLKTSAESSDDGAGMDYWPSYSNIAPSYRTAYLKWLATGRKDPGAYVGYVFLFVYGLERRLLADYTKLADVVSEVPLIVAELQRLLLIYGKSGSFGTYTRSLLEFVAAREYVERGTRPAITSDRLGFEPPLAIRIIAGDHAAKGAPLGTELAFAWVRSDPQINLRTPATRCPEEFKQLFGVEYERRYGVGMKLPQCKRRINTSYRPASASFGSSMELRVDLPDVTSLVGPRKKLQDIVTSCTEELDSYSRFIGRQPQARDSLEAAALLPDALVCANPPRELEDLRVRVESALGGERVAIVRAIDVIEAWLPPDGSSQKKTAGVEASRLLQRLGFGIEPDVRFGNLRIGRSDEIALFRLAGEQQEAPSRAYVGASTLLALAVAVAAADGDLSAGEVVTLRNHVSSALDLGPAEQLRLIALFEWLIRNPPKLPAAKAIDMLDTASRRAVAWFLVQLACVDGTIDPAEVRVLTRVYSLLGLDSALVHADVHSALGASAQTDGPVTVIPAGQDITDYRVPNPEDIQVPRKARVILSAQEIVKRQNEAAAVARLLNTVFQNDEAPSPPSAGVDRSKTPGRTYGSLDENHSRLLERLGTREEWPLSDFERLVVDERQLLLGGAVEALNECALETADELLLETGETIQVNMDVYREMVK